LKTCSRADAGAWFNYPFLTQKERDNETGLDYFLARYYSSTQGRFTSPDEFTGGPDELYSFADAASANPTFYADLKNPQSLNKYQYTYNNPLRYTDPDGHCPDGQPCPALIVPTPNLINGGIGGAKALANIGIGMNNVLADFGAGNARHIEPYKADNFAQAVGMVITNDVSIFGALLGGRAQIGGVAIADAETTAVVASEVGNAARTTETAATLKPGPFAEGSIPARGPQRNFNTAERAANKANFEASGCHTCGTRTAGTKSGNAVLDHQPPTGVNENNAAQRLYPQCLACSRRQGGDVNAWKKGLPGSP
jgi:RHS repeat-associated protein